MEENPVRQESKNKNESVSVILLCLFCTLTISDITLFTGGVNICWQLLPPHFKANYRSK